MDQTLLNLLSTIVGNSYSDEEKHFTDMCITNLSDDEDWKNPTWETIYSALENHSFVSCKTVEFLQENMYENDHLSLALNHWNCYDEGRHEKTSDDDWELFTESIKSVYNKDMYSKLENRLVERDGVVPVKDKYTSEDFKTWVQPFCEQVLKDIGANQPVPDDDE
jgi:hypothetical protein